MTQTFRPHLAFTINYFGPARELCTSIKVGHPSLTGEFDPNKKFADFARGIWDTGATNTVITSGVVDALQLKPTGRARAKGAMGGGGDVPTYCVDIILPNKVTIQNVNVISDVIGDSFDVLIGMDIIAMGDFFISGAEGKTKFSFCIPPHEAPTCLVEKSDKINAATQKRLKKARKGIR